MAEARGVPAVRPAAPPPARLSFRVAADADAVWARILADPQVRAADEPAPEPAPPHAASLLVARRGEQVWVRHWSGPADAVSPVLALSLRRGDAVTAIEGRLVQPKVATLFGAPARRRSIGPALVPVALLAAVAVLAYAIAGSALLWALPLLLLLFAIPSSLVMLPALALWNAQSRRVQREALVAWVGRTFVPIALPEADDDDPFR